MNGIVEYCGAHHLWYAQFDTGMSDQFGQSIATGSGHSPDHATLQCLQNAEVDFAWHGGVQFNVCEK